MKKLAYEGDSTCHGGKILSGSDCIKIKSRRAARTGDTMSCPIHGDNQIVEGGTSMTDARVPVSRDSDRTQRGSFLITTSNGAAVR
ncbi:MAG TPA: PAAR domain-containing protein [Paraburkholderia sp.]|nr:PAAR domain-containing protein [Paraburkholderia sp.]